jgi:hypothetical protein
MQNQDNTGWLGVGGVILRMWQVVATLLQQSLWLDRYHQMINAGSL